jgi:thiamine pyrophosphate-dependent acetolactate synthase large subunit-like protein
MAKRVADIAVETLQAAGVKHCWGVPGDPSNHLLRKRISSKVICTHANPWRFQNTR